MLRQAESTFKERIELAEDGDSNCSLTIESEIYLGGGCTFKDGIELEDESNCSLTIDSGICLDDAFLSCSSTGGFSSEATSFSEMMDEEISSYKMTSLVSDVATVKRKRRHSALEQTLSASPVVKVKKREHDQKVENKQITTVKERSINYVRTGDGESYAISAQQTVLSTCFTPPSARIPKKEATNQMVRQTSLQYECIYQRKRLEDFVNSQELESRGESPKARRTFSMKCLEETNTDFRSIQFDSLVNGTKEFEYSLQLVENPKYPSTAYGCIGPETLQSLIDPMTGTVDSKYILLDCRYPFEYEGGHIKGATNFYSAPSLGELFFSPDLKKTKEMANKIPIFYCEFSQKRGPGMAKALREMDRKRNAYPNLSFSEMYVLDQGYKNFFEQSTSKQFCLPSQYVTMLDPKHASELAKHKHHHQSKSKVIRKERSTMLGNFRRTASRRKLSFHECNKYSAIDKEQPTEHEEGLSKKSDQDSCVAFDGTTNSKQIPRIVSVEENSPAYLHCSITPNSDNIVAWIRLKDKTLLTAGSKSFTTDGRFQISPRTENDWVLIIRRTEIGDTGCYICEINTEPNTLMSPVYLEVRQRKTTLSIKIVAADFILNCTVSGASPKQDEVIWSLNDKAMDLTQQDKYLVWTEGGNEGSMSYLLRVLSRKDEDAGIYSCAGNNLPKAAHTILIMSKIVLLLLSIFIVVSSAGRSQLMNEICQSLKEPAFTEFESDKSPITLIQTGSQCFVESNIVSAPKPEISWKQNDILFESSDNKAGQRLDEIMDREHQQIAWESTRHRIRVFAEDDKTTFTLNAFNPCTGKVIKSKPFTVSTKSCPSLKRPKRFINSLVIPGILRPSRSKSPLSSPFIATLTTMRMELAGNMVTLACQSKSFPHTTNTWHLLSNEDDEKEQGVNVDDTHFSKSYIY
uniref:Protein-tyrosine-phosphatase n=1 Tax=Rhabditophanes sp. KR3021 TaxID=114890 RepID=A0AC35U0T0_9BILA